ncbi:MAG: outer membrane beta-barrel protein [Mangrovibacterium sp.]
MNHFRIIYLTALVFVLLIISNAKAGAQVAIVSGVNLSTVRSQITLENKKPIWGYHSGFHFQYYPFQNFQNISIINGVELYRKGYRQDFGENYDSRFWYWTFPVLLNYSFSDQFALQAGAELSALSFTNIKQSSETYNHFDTGLALGVSFFNNKRVSCYAMCVYGLLPMLDYYEIDELGNFTRELHDMKNLSFSMGVKINLYNEKIRFYKQ